MTRMSDLEKDKRKKKKNKETNEGHNYVEETIRKAQEQAEKARRQARQAEKEARKYTRGMPTGGAQSPGVGAMPQWNPGPVPGAQGENVGPGNKAPNDSTRAAVPEDLLHVSKNVGKKWRQFLRQLGMHDSEMEQIYDGYHSRGTQEVIYQSLLLWHQRGPETANIGTLGKALAQCDYHEAASELSP